MKTASSDVQFSMNLILACAHETTLRNDDNYIFAQRKTAQISIKFCDCCNEDKDDNEGQAGANIAGVIEGVNGSLERNRRRIHSHPVRIFTPSRDISKATEKNGLTADSSV